MDAFAQQRTAQRAQRLGLSQLACVGRHTLTGLLYTGGRQGRDWSADYRFFAQGTDGGPKTCSPPSCMACYR